MNNNITELVFLLDRSGSMGGLEADTIGGFNSMLLKQKEGEGTVLVSTLLFDHECQVLHDRVPLNRVNPMTEKEYYVRGSTALLDAMGGAIHHIANVHKYAREEDRPQKTIFVITTDGMENASSRYRAGQVKKMVEHEQEKYGWEFLFLGANMDAISVAGGYGIRSDRAVRYENDGEGIECCYSAISNVICEMRSAKAAPMGAEWKSGIERDFKKRHKG